MKVCISLNFNGNCEELHGAPPEEAGRAMMGMVKLDIEELEAARSGSKVEEAQ